MVQVSPEDLHQKLEGLNQYHTFPQQVIIHIKVKYLG